METKTYEIPSSRYNPNLIGVEDESQLIPGSEIVIKEPPNPNPYQSILLVPGFGHTVGNIGNSFNRLAEALADKLSMTTAIAVPDTRDEVEMSHMNVIRGGVGIAIDHALHILNAPVHLIGFSRHSEPVIEDALRVAEWDRHNFRPKAPSSQILSVTLCGPATWEDLVKIMKQKGVFKPTTDEKGEVVLVGKRQIKVSPFINLPVFGSRSSWDTHTLINLVPRLEALNIPVRILAGEGDPVVARSYSESFAKMVGGKLEIIKPSSEENNLHDFDDPNLIAGIIGAIDKAKISSPREFTRQPQTKDRLPELK